jgi:ElaB/YqjD/DUF883 family membrane-anchored ribosome-binding protein
MYELETPANRASAKRAMQKLLADMKILASDTREILRQTTGHSGEHFARLQERTRDALSAVEERMGPLQHAIAEHGRHAANVSAEHLRAHRWSSLWALAAIAFAAAAVFAWQNESRGENTINPSEYPPSE